MNREPTARPQVAAGIPVLHGGEDAKRVFVAGATGAIGQYLVPALVAAGHEVTGTTRSPGKAAQISSAGASPVIVDGLDRRAVLEAVASAKPEVIVHQMTTLAGLRSYRKFDREFAATNELRTRGTDHLLEAAGLVGTRRLIAQSYTGWPNARTGGPVKTEDDPLEENPLKQARESLAAIRHVEESVPGAVPEGLVLRYGSFYGPGASLELLDLIRDRKVPIIGGGHGVWSFIEITDAAAATLAAVRAGDPGIYNITDDEPAPQAEWLPYLAGCLGTKPPMRMPTWLARLLAGDVIASQMTEMRGSSNAKAKANLGWQPRYASWREGFPAWVRSSEH
jgi:nucleoside-diphosphate-sugar epimerase